MKWNNKKDINKCINQAIETYTDLLSENDDISESEMDDYEFDIKNAFNNQEYEDQWANSQELDIRPLHSEIYENATDDLFCGCMVILRCLDNQNKTLILDGNHRFNTIKEKGINIPIYVIFVDGFMPK